MTERLTEPRVDVDAWGHPVLPHISLDFTVVDAEVLHWSSAMRKVQDTAPAAAQAEKTKENEHGKTQGGLEPRAAQRAVRPGTGRSPPEFCWVQASNHQVSWTLL